MRVLVAEEDRQVSRFIEEGLNEAGHVVDVTRDGDGATMSAQVARYDIILLGIALPRKNGFQVARALRRDGQTVPILMLTSRHSAEDVIRGLDSGANDYLPMPFRLDQLLARIRLLVCLGAAVS
jgi:DNA-binding response OmpR family regulator